MTKNQYDSTISLNNNNRKIISFKEDDPSIPVLPRIRVMTRVEAIKSLKFRR